MIYALRLFWNGVEVNGKEYRKLKNQKRKIFRFSKLTRMWNVDYLHFTACDLQLRFCSRNRFRFIGGSQIVPLRYTTILKWLRSGLIRTYTSICAWGQRLTVFPFFFANKTKICSILTLPSWINDGINNRLQTLKFSTIFGLKSELIRRSCTFFSDCKVERVFPMAIWSEFRLGKYRDAASRMYQSLFKIVFL